MQEDQCRKVPIVDEAGGKLNDPAAIKHCDDREIRFCRWNRLSFQATSIVVARLGYS